MIQIDLTRKEIALKEKALEVMKEGMQSNKENIEAMTQSISTIGESIKDGLNMLSKAMVQCQQMNMYQQNTSFMNAPWQGQYLFSSTPISK